MGLVKSLILMETAHTKRISTAHDASMILSLITTFVQR